MLLPLETQKLLGDLQCYATLKAHLKLSAVWSLNSGTKLTYDFNARKIQKVELAVRSRLLHWDLSVAARRSVKAWSDGPWVHGDLFHRNGLVARENPPLRALTVTIKTAYHTCSITPMPHLGWDYFQGSQNMSIRAYTHDAWLKSLHSSTRGNVHVSKFQCAPNGLFLDSSGFKGLWKLKKRRKRFDGQSRQSLRVEIKSLAALQHATKNNIKHTAFVHKCWNLKEIHSRSWRICFFITVPYFFRRFLLSLCLFGFSFPHF